MTYTYGPASQAVLNGGAGQDNLSLSSFSGKNQSIAFSSGDRVVQADGLTIDQIETLHWQSGSGNDKLSLTVKATGNYAWHANGGQDHAILDLSHIGGQAQFRYSGTQGNGQWTVGGEQVKLGLYGIEKLTITGNAQQNTFIGGSFENMFYGGGGADNLTGGALQDRLYGQSGADSLGGAGGDDILYGGGGNDTIAGEAGNDRLYGGAGHDQLFGDLHGGVTGDDQLFGGTGHDRLHGGLGSDDLTGGAGRDKFIFRKGDGTDRVLDFELGLDKIDLRQTRFDADDLIFTQHSGYVEITFVGDDSADGTQIQVLDLTVAELETPTNFLF
jgi:Ca2+-binding RTX toxin-like protein